MKSYKYYDVWEIKYFLYEKTNLTRQEIDEAFRKIAIDLSTYNGSLITVFLKDEIDYLKEKTEANYLGREKDIVDLAIYEYLFNEIKEPEIKIHYWW